MRDAIAITGFLCLTIGAGLAWLPAGLMVAGVLLLLAGVAGHVLGRKKRR